MSDNFLKKLPKEVEEIMFFLFNQQIEQQVHNIFMFQKIETVIIKSQVFYVGHTIYFFH